MALSLNSVQLIGNLTRDPELRYTSTGKAVCTIGLATNRSWMTEAGEKKEETEFHRIVVWGKLAELCSQLLVKGAKAYFRGRISTRKWTGQDGIEKTTTEIIADDMIVCSSKKTFNAEGTNAGDAHQTTPPAQPAKQKQAPAKSESATVEQASQQPESAHQAHQEEEIVSPDDIPF